MDDWNSVTCSTGKDVSTSDGSSVLSQSVADPLMSLTFPIKLDHTILYRRNNCYV